LLLVLSKLYDPNLVSLDQTSDEVIISLEEELKNAEDEIIITINSKNNIKKAVTEKKIDLDILQNELKSVQGRYDLSLSEPELLQASESNLEEAKQKISEEIKRLQPNYERAANEQ